MAQTFRHGETAKVEQSDDITIKFSAPIVEEGQAIPDDIPVTIPDGEGNLDIVKEVTVQEAKITVYFEPQEVRSYMKWKVRSFVKSNNPGETVFLKFGDYVIDIYDTQDPRVVQYENGDVITYTHDGKYIIPKYLPNETSEQITINSTDHKVYTIEMEQTTGSVEMLSNKDVNITIKNKDFPNIVYNGNTNTVIDGIVPGNYLITFPEVVGAYKPNWSDITLDLNYLNHKEEKDYVIVASLRVNISNENLNSPAVQWRLVNGYAWHDFGETITISEGMKEIILKELDQFFIDDGGYYKYITPEGFLGIENAVSGESYVINTGYQKTYEVLKSNLTVSIEPREISDSVTWELLKVGTNESIAKNKKSGDIVGNLLGQYIIKFSSLSGYNKPSIHNTTIFTSSYEEGSTISIIGEYTEAPVNKNSLEIIPIFNVTDEDELLASVPPSNIIGSIGGPNFYTLFTYDQIKDSPFTDLNDGTYQIITEETVDFFKPGSFVVTLENGIDYKKTITWNQKI